METPVPPAKSNSARACAIIGLLLIAGCVDPVARNDYIDASAGDAVAANRAMQTGEPWPRDSFDTRPRSDGARALNDIQKYRSGVVVGDGKSAPSTQ